MNLSVKKHLEMQDAEGFEIGERFHVGDTIRVYAECNDFTGRLQRIVNYGFAIVIEGVHTSKYFKFHEVDAIERLDA